MHSAVKKSQSPQGDGSTNKAIRIAAQSLVRQMRNIAPAPVSLQKSHPLKQPKTLVLKTIPLKVKQVAPTTIKMPPRQATVAVQGSSKTAASSQQPTEVNLDNNVSFISSLFIKMISIDLIYSLRY